MDLCVKIIEESKDGDPLNNVWVSFKDCGVKNIYAHTNWSGNGVINGQFSWEILIKTNFEKRLIYPFIS